MVELRWTVPEGTSTDAPRLQYRQCSQWPAAWGEWTDVPTVVVPAGVAEPHSRPHLRPGTRHVRNDAGRLGQPGNRDLPKVRRRLQLNSRAWRATVSRR